MAAERALAIVVRGTDWSETSRITTLFTREFGKIRALAKGGRRLKSNFDVAFDLLTVCQIMFFRKAHGGLDLLTEARMEEQFPALRQNLHALYAGYYIAELLADGTQDYDPHPPLFDAAVEALRSLGARSDAASLAVKDGPTGRGERSEAADPSPLAAPPLKGEGQKPVGDLAPPSSSGKGAGGVRSEDNPSPLASLASPPLKREGQKTEDRAGGVRSEKDAQPVPDAPGSPILPTRGEGNSSSSFSAAVSAFELVWLRELGYSPRLDACAVCEVEVAEPAGPVLFSPSAGGILCPQCGPSVPDRLGVSRLALGSLRALSEGDATPELPTAVRGEVRQLLGQTVSCVLGRRPRLLRYVDGR